LPDQQETKSEKGIAHSEYSHVKGKQIVKKMYKTFMESIESKNGRRVPYSPKSGAASPKIKLNFNNITGFSPI